MSALKNWATLENNTYDGNGRLSARWYYPAIQRFVSEDSQKYSSLKNPITLNRYEYAGDSPEVYVDPSGHDYFGDNGCYYNEADCSSSSNENGDPNGQQTQQAGPGFWNWFWSNPWEFGPFLVNIAGDVASIFDPFVKYMFEGIIQTIVSKGLAAVQGLGAAFGDLQNMFQLFVNHDLTAIAGMATSWLESHASCHIET